MQFWSEGRNIDPWKPNEYTRLDTVAWFVVVQLVFASQWCATDGLYLERISGLLVGWWTCTSILRASLNWILCSPLPGSCRRPWRNVQLWESVEPAPASAALPWSRISGFGKHWESCLPVWANGLNAAGLPLLFPVVEIYIIQRRCERHVFSNSVSLLAILCFSWFRGGNGKDDVVISRLVPPDWDWNQVRMIETNLCTNSQRTSSGKFHFWRKQGEFWLQVHPSLGTPLMAIVPDGLRLSSNTSRPDFLVSLIAVLAGNLPRCLCINTGEVKIFLFSCVGNHNHFHFACLRLRTAPIWKLIRFCMAQGAHFVWKMQSPFC